MCNKLIKVLKYLLINLKLIIKKSDGTIYYETNLSNKEKLELGMFGKNEGEDYIFEDSKYQIKISAANKDKAIATCPVSKYIDLNLWASSPSIADFFLKSAIKTKFALALVTTEV